MTILGAYLKYVELTVRHKLKSKMNKTNVEKSTSNAHKMRNIWNEYSAAIYEQVRLQSDTIPHSSINKTGDILFQIYAVCQFTQESIVER